MPRSKTTKRNDPVKKGYRGDIGDAPDVETPAVPPAGPPVGPPAPAEPHPEVGHPQVDGSTPGQMQAVKQFGEMKLPQQPESNIHCITVVGQIEGHIILPPQNKTTKYEHILPQLVAVEQNPAIEGLLVILNTVGGDVEAGLAIAEMLESLSKPSVSLVLGGGHSIAVPVAVSCDYSFISNTATMTIHPLRLSGLVIGVPQTYEYLDKMQDRVIKFVCSHSKISEEKFRELMLRTGELVRDVGTVLVGKDAVDAGLMDEVGGLSQALDKLRSMIAERRNRARARDEVRLQ